MRYHFIGIKGSGMSSLAQIMYDLGYEVQGSDKEEYFFTQAELEKRQIKLLPYDSKNIDHNMTVIVGASIKLDNQELKRAVELGTERYDYFQLLGKLSKQFKTIAICGCHGKTTTTAMMAHVFNNIIGANYLIGDGTGYANKKNKYFIIEACEYCRHFLHYYPKYTIITNIELDHIDYYKDLDDIKSAYIDFANQTEDTIIACGDDKNIKDISYKVNKPMLLYGLNNDNDFYASNVIQTTEGSEFDVIHSSAIIGHFIIPFSGTHMILNSLAVIAMSFIKNFNMSEVAFYLRTFPGAKRRFTETVIGDNVVVDDYAHHPTEIKATIEAAKQKYPSKKIIAVFMPHTFSRTKAFHKEIAEALNTATKAYVLDIYPAREKQEDWPDINSSLIINLLNNGEGINSDNIDKLLNHSNSVTIFMSPADLHDLEEKYIKLLEEKEK